MDLYFQEHDIAPNAPSIPVRRPSSAPPIHYLRQHILSASTSPTATTNPTNSNSTNHNDHENVHVSSQNLVNSNSTTDVSDFFTLLATTHGPHHPIAQQPLPIDEVAQPSGPPPASAMTLHQLPHILPSTTAAQKSCPVCTDDFVLVQDSSQQLSPSQSPSSVTMLPCRHFFHRPCVVAWLQRHCTCPVCRKELPTDDHAYEEGKKLRRRAEAAAQMHSLMFN